MLRTLLILASVLLLAACNDDETDAQRPTRIVCTDGGRTIVDDFAVNGVDTSGAALFWNSSTQHGHMRATGNCVTYPQVRPTDWKPVIAGLSAQ